MAIRHYILAINVNLHTTILDQDGDAEMKLVGYYQIMGVTAADLDQAVGLVTDAIEDGAVDPDDLQAQEYETGEHEEFDLAFRRNTGVAIWYRSGRILYP